MARSGPVLDARMAPDAPHMSPDDFPDGSNDPQMDPNVPRVTPRLVQTNSNEPRICRNDAGMTPTFAEMTMGSPQQDPIQPALGWDGLHWVELIFGPHPMMIPSRPGGMRGAIE